MDSQSLMCLDWILASTEYIEFVYMMLEFKVISFLIICCQGAQDWDGEDYQYDAGQAYEYGGEDEENDQA